MKILKWVLLGMAMLCSLVSLIISGYFANEVTRLREILRGQTEVMMKEAQILSIHHVMLQRLMKDHYQESILEAMDAIPGKQIEKIELFEVEVK